MAVSMIAIRDRRELPFFQVWLRAVGEIRNQVSGPRRLRAIGFYTLLCQLANEQRHVGEHRIVRVTYDGLAHRGQMSKRTVKMLLDVLLRADAVRYERLNDPERGATISLLHLLVRDGPWTPITVVMADLLARERCGGHLLRDLGLVVVLLEFCAEQREQRGGLSAEVMRGDIAKRTGLTVDRIDDCNRILEAVGILQITRRRAENGGRNLPSLYTITEAPAVQMQGGEREPSGRTNGSDSMEERYQQGGKTVLAPRLEGSGRTEDRYQQAGDSATRGTISPPSFVRTRSGPESPTVETTNPLLDVPRDASASSGGPARLSREEQLCDALVTTWEPALGDNPRRAYANGRRQWIDAARALLDRHPRERLDQALAYMVTDEILGSQALTMPAFAKVADRLIARAHARQNRLRSRTPTSAGGGEHLTWPEAKTRLERAIQRHGRDHREAALQELAAASPLLPIFVERVRWSSLCDQPLRYVEGKYAETWADVAEHAHEAPGEQAA